MDKKIKIRISFGPNTAMGPGKAQLLEAIKTHGSISKAAADMGMSYRRAWELVNVMNECFKSPLVSTSHGGTHGGGSEVTELGECILRSYRTLEKKAAKSASKELDHIFSCLA